MNDTTREDVVVSFKAHAGYDAPTVTFRGATVAEVADKILSAEQAGLWAIIGNADTNYKAAFNLGAGVGATPVTHPSTAATTPHTQPQAPVAPAQPRQGYQQSQQSGPPPGMTAPTCPHGTKMWRTGVSRRGPWKGWFCPAPQSDNTQCPPEWVNG